MRTLLRWTLLLLCAAPLIAQNDSDIGTNFSPFIILVMLCIFFAVVAGVFAVSYYKALKKLEQADADLRRQIGDREKRTGRSYYDSPASEASGLSSVPRSQLQSYEVPASAGSSRDNGKDPYSSRSSFSTPSRPAHEIATPSHAPQGTFSYSSLFNSDEERAKFSNEGLTYLAISEKTMQQITEGATNCIICFDKKQGRYYAEYILVKNKFLLPNYYIYNETKEMPDLMSIKRVFTLQGRLPGKITSCSPAQVRQAGDKYELDGKGVLTVR